MILLLSIVDALAEDGASGFTMAEIWQHSGLLAKSVIVMLVGMLIGSTLISIERLLAFGKATRQSMELRAAIVPHLQSGDISAALKVSQDEAYKVSYLGAILRAGLSELDLRLDRYGIDNAKMSVEKTVGQELSKLRSYLPVLATVGSTAPFVGLFGTTFGVINAFQGMASAGGSGLATISAGISEALITTAVGIGVAVVGVWLYNYFNNRVEKVAEELNSSEVDFLVWAEKQIQGPVDVAAK